VREQFFRKFASFEEADEADRERIRIMVELIFPDEDEAPTRFERVCRITQLGER
jgi:hypothetical protein